jgi:hypothetical protein
MKNLELMTVESFNKLSFLSFLKEFEPNILLSNTLLFYEGEVNHEITKALSYTTEQHMAVNGTSRLTQKKIFNVMIECLQNIDKHSLEISLQESSIAKKGAILVAEDVKSYFILAGNPISHHQQDTLSDIIANLNNKEKQDLRHLYKRQLENGKISEKGGAGLGFIDMARKSGNDINFSFYPIDEKLVFFVYKIVVTK